MQIKLILVKWPLKIRCAKWRSIYDLHKAIISKLNTLLRNTYTGLAEHTNVTVTSFAAAWSISNVLLVARDVKYMPRPNSRWSWPRSHKVGYWPHYHVIWNHGLETKSCCNELNTKIISNHRLAVHLVINTAIAAATVWTGGYEGRLSELFYMYRLNSLFLLQIYDWKD